MKPRLFQLSPRWAPYALLAPFLVLFVVFGIFPLLFSLHLAFQSWEPTSGLRAMQFVGLDNFAFALQDEWFWKSLQNTFWLALLAGVPQHLVAIPVACFIHAKTKRWRNLVVGGWVRPDITSPVAGALRDHKRVATDYGLVNSVIRGLFGGAGVDWLNQPPTIQASIAMLVFWRFVGFNIVLYLAALQSIPNDLYEAATIDGASPWQQFRWITLPSLRPAILFGVTLSVIGGLQLFEEPFILTGGKGGTDQAGMTAAVYLYRLAFDFNDFGAASAMSWLLFVVVAVMTWATHKTLGRPQ